jgi:hypothetical protein
LNTFHDIAEVGVDAPTGHERHTADVVIDLLVEHPPDSPEYKAALTELFRRRHHYGAIDSMVHEIIPELRRVFGDPV